MAAMFDSFRQSRDPRARREPVEVSTHLQIQCDDEEIPPGTTRIRFGRTGRNKRWLDVVMTRAETLALIRDLMGLTEVASIDEVNHFLKVKS